MSAGQVGMIVAILLMTFGVGIGAFFVIKSVATPKRVDGVKKLLKQNKTAQAVKLAKSVVAKNTNDYVAHYYLGKAYQADGKNELALMEYKVVNQNAIFGKEIQELEFRKLISALYLKFNQQKEALKEFLLLTKLEPANPDNYFNVATIYDANNRSDLALGFYQKTISLNKRHVRAHAAMGLVLYKSKQLTEAKKEIDLAISLSPETFSSYYYRGKIEKENKDYPAAVKDFEKAVRDPEFRQRSLVERGTCFMAANSLDNAIEEFDKAVRYSKDDGASETLYARYFLAACYEKVRKIDMAIEQWEKIMAKNKAFRDVATKLAEYKDLQSNDSMKEYLTCTPEAFIEMCKKVALSAFSLSAQSAENTKSGCKIVATEQKKDNWMNMRQQLFLVQFYRESDPIEDTEVRRVVDLAKEQNYTKSILCTSSGFTRSASVYAENRPVELVPKEKLELLLSQSGV